MTFWLNFCYTTGRITMAMMKIRTDSYREHVIEYLVIIMG